jgi:FMN phosphatase YigB (HAD superfamily)
VTTAGGSERWSFTPRLAAEATVEIDSAAVSAIPYGRPEWIFWDVGLTLVHPSASEICRQLATRFPGRAWTAGNVLGALVSAAEARHLRWPTGLSGTERVHRAWAALLDVPPADGAAVLSACLARSDIYCEVDSSAPSVLAELARRGVRMGAISNSDGTLANELAHFGLASYFEVVVDSGLVGAEKPDQAIFKIALAEADAAPETTWHIGDGLVNDYLAALSVGIAPILLDRHGTYLGAFPVHRISRLVQVLDLGALASTQDTTGSRQ